MRRAEPTAGTAVTFVLGSAFSLQFGAAFAALIFPYVGPLGAVTIRLVVAAVVLMAVLRPRLRGHGRPDLLAVLAFGLVLAAMNACYYQSIDRIPIGAAVTLEFLGPLALALITSRRLLDLVWVGFGAGGVVLLSGGAPDGLDPVGVAFALAAGTLWACYILLSAQAGKRFRRADGLALAMVVGGVAILPFGVGTAGASLVDPPVLAIGALVALMSSVVPYSLELLALKRIRPGTFGILMSLEPAVAALAGVVVLSQLLGGWQLLGIALVVVASIGVTTFGKPLKEPQREELADRYLG
ncbi:MAG: EamA family transporter [Propionibacteriales bacterium]|nr:EamA family transporter [Propionibacteriales bacterium]